MGDNTLLLSNMQAMSRLCKIQQHMQQSSEKKELNIKEAKQFYKKWQLTCPQGNLIEYTCIEFACNKTALHCIIPKCANCYGLHPFCKTIPITPFADFLDQNHNNQMHLYTIFQQIEQEIITIIRQSQKELINKLSYLGLQTPIKLVLMNIFDRKDFKNLTGMDMQSLQQQIKRFQPLKKEKYIFNLCQKIKDAVKTYIKEKQEIMTSIQANQRIISKIITKEDDINFVFEALKQPRKLELLYRGSENQFSSAKFHERCDEIEHTLTLVKTEFDRVIGAYTPLKWSSPSAWTPFADNSGRSFLLQINLKEKYPLTQHLYSIYCHQMHGPRFGRSDLAITNKCNQNNCTGNFPASYNIIGKYINGQQSYTAFSGSPSGFYFRTVEYEVFRVIF